MAARGIEEGSEVAKPGHNSTNVSAQHLRSIVKRIEHLEEEKAGLQSDIKDIYAEAHGNGYCKKTLRKVIQLRKVDASEREESEHLLDTYLRALGMAPELEDA